MMNRLIASAALAMISLILLTGRAPAGSGIGKGAPPAAEAPASAEDQTTAEPNADAEQGGAAEPGTAFDTATAPETPTAEQTASGKVGEVHPGTMSFTCRCESGDVTFVMTAGTIVRKGGGAGTFSDIAPGESVKVQYHVGNDGSVADLVMISP